LFILRLIVVSLGIEALFPTPLWMTEWDQAAQCNPVLRRVIENLMVEQEDDRLKRKSNRRGWKGPSSRLDCDPWTSDAWSPLIEFLYSAVREILVDDRKFFLATPGLNVHGEGGVNMAHVHPGCILSGVYYIACPSGSGDLAFNDPRVQCAYAMHYRYFKHDLGGSQVRVSPGEGALLLFPSWLEHQVEPNSTFGLRMSLPINVYSECQATF
jgi:uncharacterized protein (TIGR02466 family)